jgi:mono/diheme cytochrome c family protein/glucose/arabinose dehydrogenase
MNPKPTRSPWSLIVALASCVAATSLVLVAQTPTPATQNPPPAQPQGAPGQGGPQGRGRAGGAQDLSGIDFTKQPPVLAKTPEEQLKTFILQPGYRLELVLADPIIQEPTAIAFDGNGRMFVVEDRSYMLDLDMTGQLDPISRISLHVDTNNDGVYDKHTVFVDNLVFPRFVTPFGPNTILTKESNAQEVWKYTDTNGDGVADKKELFDTGYGRLANIEGQEAFLTWTLDNWMYSTYNAFRARWTPHGVIKEPTGSNRGEWGVTQDNDGKMWFESGAPGVPVSFQFPIVYGNFAVQDELEPDFRIPWGAPVRVADMQGGLNATRMPDGSLKSVTGSAGNDIYRGHRLPKDLVGDYLYGEPVGRIVRRIRAEKKEGLTFLHNVYPNNEFIKSLDPLFRPVDITTAPDGTVYITDMYHGIIQVGNFAGPGTYLRARVQQYDLDKVIHKGRIWRLVYDGVKPDRSDAMRRDRVTPRMNNETPAQLVAHLSHPNGWWRDTAQQLLVLKQDKSVVPALQLIVRSSKNLLARFHAMWTLEGLGSLKPALVRQLMEDSEPRMRIQAIRASETLYKAGDRSFASDYGRMANDPDVDVVIQALLTMNRWKVPEAAATTKATMESNPARGVQVVGTTMLSAAATATARARANLTPEQQAQLDRGGQIYNELCFACHGTDAMGTPKPELATTMAPPLAGSPRVNGHRDYITKVVLHGLMGPVDGKTYTDMMVPMGTFNDEWVAAVTSYVRNNFGNSGGFVTAADVARVRAANADRKTLWTLPELTASIPTALFTDGWKLSASHNSEAASGGLTLTGWNAGDTQQPGMWFQVELPRPETVTEVQFLSPPPGGRGGAGNAAAVTTSGAPVAAPPGFPRGYKIEVSQDAASWTAAAEGSGNGLSTVATFQPVLAKFVRVTLTAGAPDAPAWSIQNLKIFALQQPEKKPIVPASR